VVVALPEELPAADREANDFAEFFPMAHVLKGSDATAEAVASVLSDSPPLVHFACHGAQDVADPFAGQLRLHDRALRVDEISRLRNQDGEMVFLSACETYRGGAGLVDESVTVATAFQIAGYRRVIATLWPIGDTLAPRVARRVYAELTRNSSGDVNVDGAAMALHAATSRIRQETPDAPWRWAPYTHVGP
jgi:CHAT domain-containing protein